MPTHNIPPQEWGACVWRSLRWVAEGFPDEPSDADRDHYRVYFESLAYVLPCERCQQHYRENWKKHPIQLQSRDMLKRWLYEIYKESTKQPDFTYEQWLSKTSTRDMTSTSSSSSAVEMTLAVCVGIVIGVGGYMYYNSISQKRESWFG